MEHIWIEVWLIFRHRSIFCDASWRTSRNIHFPDFSTFSFNSDHYSWNHFVDNFWCVLHVTRNDVNCIPHTMFHLFFSRDFFFNKEARVETLSISVIEIDTGYCVVIVQTNISRKNVICFRLKLQQLLWRVEWCIVRWRIVLIAPWGSVGITVSIILVLQILLAGLDAILNL